MPKKWKCENCGEDFKLKRDLVKHLDMELDMASDTVYCVEFQLEKLGIDPYKEEK
jgi:hypothetical protein